MSILGRMACFALGFGLIWGVLSVFNQIPDPKPKSKLDEGATVRPIRALSGDTIVVATPEGEELRLHLWGTEAPSTNEPFAVPSRSLLDGLIRDQELGYVQESERSDGTVEARVLVRAPKDSSRKPYELNPVIVEQGIARWNPQQVTEESIFGAAQESARTSKRGLWALSFSIGEKTRER